MSEAEKKPHEDVAHESAPKAQEKAAEKAPAREPAAAADSIGPVTTAQTQIAKAQEKAAKAGRVKIKKSLVNMSLHDGSQLEVGKPAEITRGEYDRLKKDARGPFFEE